MGAASGCAKYSPNHVNQLAMPDYNIYFEIFGHKKKMTITAHDEPTAKEMLKNKVSTLYMTIIRSDEVKQDDDGMVKRMMDLFGMK
jgi:hypothetical protein